MAHLSTEFKLALVGSIAALVLHHGEWRRRDAQLSGLLSVILLGHWLLVIVLINERVPVTATPGLIMLADSSFIFTLLCSMGIYRYWFHPLRHLPGPKLARLSMLYRFYWYSRGQHARKLHEWHQQYGDVVRYGPNAISIIDPSCVEAIHRLDKGDFYRTGVSGDSSLAKIRPAAEHRAKRQIWANAFTPTTLRSYAPIVQQRCTELVHHLSTSSGVVDLYDYLTRFTFDVTGDISFSGKTSLIRDGDSTGLLRAVRYAVQRSGRIGALHWIHRPVQWLVRHLPGRCLPVWLSTNRAFYHLARTSLAARLKAEPITPDVFSHITETDKARRSPFSAKQLASAAALMMGAGVDTTSISLAMTQLLLLQHQTDVLGRLRDELDALFPRSTHDELDVSVLAKAPYLNAVITEALRLSPALPSGSERVVGPNGIVLPNGLALDPGTTVVMPHWALHRRQASFDRPDDFLPDRWLDDKIKADPSSFLAFSAGHAGCLAKDFGLMQLRLVTASIVLALDIESVHGFDADAYRANVKDFYAPQIDSLPVIVKPRPYVQS